MTTGSETSEAIATIKPRRGAAFWRATLERQQASGLSQREFCEHEGLAPSTFALWSRRLRDEVDSDWADADPVQFVEVRPRDSRSVRSVESSLHIRLDLGEGLILEIRRG